MMMKKYIILGFFLLTEIILFIISLFLAFPWRELMYAIMIVIPLLPIIFYFVEVTNWWVNPKIPEVQTIATREEFLKAQPYICEECFTFTSNFREICENCGKMNTLRKSTKKDYNNFIVKK
jgi:hypothetical protein